MCTQEMILNSLYFLKKIISECSTKDGTHDLLHTHSNDLFLNRTPSSLSSVFYLTSSVCWYPFKQIKQIWAMKKSYLPAFCLGSQYLEGKVYFAWLFPSIAPVALGLVVGRRSGWEVCWDKTPYLVARNQKGKDWAGRWFSDENTFCESEWSSNL